MALEPRPHTQQPDTLVEISAEDLRNMTTEQIVQWAEDAVGVRLDPSWTRTRMLTHLMGLATELVDFG